MCRRILKHQTSVEGEIPFYKIGTFGKQPDAYISKKVYKEFKEKYAFPKKGEILISASGTIGRTVVYDGNPAYFQDSNIIWLANDEAKALNSFLVNCYKRVKWNTESGTIARLYNDNVRSKEVKLPPLAEQERIVAVLETWDKMLEKLARKIELKQAVKRGLMQQLLTGKRRLAGFTEEWQTVKLGDVAEFSKGKKLPKSELNSEAKYEAIHYGELFTKYSEKITTIFNRTNSNKKMKMSKKNDILMPTSDVTPRGLSTASFLNKSGVVLGGDILIIHPSERLNGLFFCYIVNLNKKEVIRLTSGTTVFHLYGSDMKKFRLNLPSLAEQSAIAAILTTADEEIEVLQAQLALIEKQKQFLLNQLVTGELRTPEDLMMFG